MRIEAAMARRLIGSAITAPSSHNTQPWLFRVSQDAIALLADRTRALAVNDPEDRELTISCGAALFALRVAAAEAGLSIRVTRFPDAGTPDCLALIEPGGAEEPELAALAPALGQRRTCRKRFQDRPLAERGPLVQAVEREGAWILCLESQDRHHVAALVAEGDAVQWANPSWRRELAAWMHPRRSGDGLSLPSLVSPLARMVVRSIDLGRNIGAKDRALAEGAPLLAVLGTADDTPADWLQAGEALQRLLLSGCLAGLQASYLNQPIQVAALRATLRRHLGADGFPQVLLRLGYPREPVPAAARRPLEAVLLS